jgi:cell division protein ZapA (FtsZ GTPase activity inhibitor)
MDEIEKLGEDIADAGIVMEYDAFKNDCGANVGYLMNMEPLPIGEDLKGKIEAAKAEFRQIRDDIGGDGKFGETAAMEANDVLSKVKAAYIDIYFEEHKKHRLTVTEYKKKVELMDSAAYGNLKRLSAIDEILPVAKLKAIETDLAALKVCYELTPEQLKTKHYCEKCMFQLCGGNPLVKGKVDEIEDRIDKLTSEWTNTLLNTISDPLVLNQKEFLSAEQRTAIDKFVKDKKLPDKVDQFFVNAIKDLLKGFDTVTVDGAELIYKLAALGACDTDTFRQKIDAIIADIAKGKDKSQLRIIIRQ